MPLALRTVVKKAVAESTRDTMTKLEAMETVLLNLVESDKHLDASSQTKKFQNMFKQLQEMWEVPQARRSPGYLTSHRLERNREE